MQTESYTHLSDAEGFFLSFKERILTETRRELETLKFIIRADCWDLTQGLNGGKQDPPVDFYFH